MTTTFSASALGSYLAAVSELKKAVLEPALTAGAALFWIAALPFVAFSLVFVKVWDTLAAAGLRSQARENSLFLRRGPAKNSMTMRGRQETTRI